MDGVTLETIGNGALAELFSAELQRVLQNIADPNTDSKTKRQITINVIFKPGRDRDAAVVELKCGSKLAGIMTVESKLYIGMRRGQLIAVEHDPRQQQLFDQPKTPQLAAVSSFPEGAK